MMHALTNLKFRNVTVLTEISNALRDVESFPIKGQDTAARSTPALPIPTNSNFKKVPYSHTLSLACMGYDFHVRLQF
jgi:hypothetical protein